MTENRYVWDQMFVCGSLLACLLLIVHARVCVCLCMGNLFGIKGAFVSSRYIKVCLSTYLFICLLKSLSSNTIFLFYKICNYGQPFSNSGVGNYFMFKYYFWTTAYFCIFDHFEHACGLKRLLWAPILIN